MKDRIYRMIMFLKIFIQSIVYKNRIYLFGIPTHGNIGDQAILIAEKKFLEDNFKKFKVIEVESAVAIKLRNIFSKIVNIRGNFYCCYSRRGIFRIIMDRRRIYV